MKRSPLKRGNRVLVRRVGLQTKPHKNPQRPAPAVPPDVRDAVWARAGDACEVCGIGLTRQSPHSIHHRRPRRMGGSTAADTNRPANLVLLHGTGTDGCHGAIESERAGAYRWGLLLTANADPSATPVRLLSHGGWVLLDDDGTFTPIPTEES